MSDLRAVCDLSKATYEQQSEIDRLKSELTRITAERDKLRGFANEAWDEWQLNECYESDLDHTARKHGLVDENYQPTPLLTGEQEE